MPGSSPCSGACWKPSLEIHPLFITFQDIKMLTTTKMQYKILLVLVVCGIILLSFGVHQRVLQRHIFGSFCPNAEDPDSPLDAKEERSKVVPMDFLEHFVSLKEPSPRKGPTNETEELIKRIIREIDLMVPKVSFTHMDQTTSVGKSRASILNPKDRYCVGDNLTVHLDMFDYLGNRKTYGGDFLRARVHSPDLAAAASGRITDFGNGSYQVDFTLFWVGKVKISLLLIHPSEAVAALWRGRNAGFKYVSHAAKFSSPTQSIDTACGYDLQTTEEVCEYMEKKDEYPFYCIKPPQMSCSSMTHVASSFTRHSYLTDLERPLFDSSHIRAEIPHGLQDLDVLKCTNDSAPAKEPCKTGTPPLPFPGGYFYQNVWYPVSCGMRRFTSQDEINGCLRGKSLRLIGDSTLIQWMKYFTDTFKNLKDLDLYDEGWQKSLLKVDPDRNIQIRFQKHGDPFVGIARYSVLENPTIPEVIAQVGGNKHTVIVFTAATHFKPFPLHIFIRRVINIRKAIQGLLLRSPDTKVILKTENTSFQDQNFEKISDFHGYVQYLIMNRMLQGLNIGTVDAWDMTTAMASNNVHPPPNVIENEINLLLTFLC
ncbi:NXPE family member 4-like [Lissotriton helveticus]